MAIFQLFSKRKKALEGEASDVYQYEKVPQTLRVQIVHILTDVLGKEYAHDSVYDYGAEPITNQVYREIVSLLCREYGVFRLVENAPSTSRNIEQLFNFILGEKDVDKVLDAIEISFRAINVYTRNYQYASHANYNERADDAIAELNQRFKEAACGYAFVDEHIIKIDSEYIHKEIVLEYLRLLNKNFYRGPQQEFMSAHQRYRNQEFKECLVDCLKAFESLMKAILEKRNWKYERTDPASKLIAVCFDKGLIPTYWQTNFTSLRSLLESGVPTVRNKTAGHGQGVEVVTVPSHVAAYALHLTASALVFLAEAEASLP